MKKLLVVLLVLGLAAPAMAASQWYWYGTARVFTGWVDNSKEFPTSSSPYNGGTPDLDTSIKSTTTDGGTQYSDAGLVLNVADTTKIGAKVVASDAISAGVELSIFQMPTAVNIGGEDLTGDGIIMRVLYGQYKFDSGTLRVGQDYTPASFLLYSNEIGDLGWGSDEIMTTHSIPYISRRPQIKLTFGGLQVAFIEHNTTPSYTALRGLTGTDDEDFSLPRIELAYQWNISPMISLRPILGYQSYEAVRHTDTTDSSKSITSYLYGLGVNLRLGPAYINLAAAGAQNPGNYGLYQPNNTITKFAYWGAGDLEDTTSMSGIAVVGMKVNPSLKVEAGFGYLKTEGKPGTKVEQTSMNYYIQAPITLAPGVFLTPEIGMLDMGDLDYTDLNTKTDQGSSTWFAAQFRIDF